MGLALNEAWYIGSDWANRNAVEPKKKFLNILFLKHVIKGFCI